MNRPRIVVLGATAVDVKAQSFGALVRAADVPGRVRVTLGGVARNTAKNLALLGADVTIVSAVGDDEFGRMIRNDLACAGVHVHNLMTVHDRRTATWAGVLGPRGDLDVGVFDGEILAVLSVQIIEELEQTIAYADLIALDATLPRTTIDTIVGIAQKHRVPLNLNPASIARAQTVADCVGKFTLVTANALEAGVLTERSIASIDDAAQAAKSLIEQGVERAIITLGAEGVIYTDARETRYKPALPTRVVDTTGAGDAFAAMFLLCHLQLCALEETLGRALRAAALTVACEESVSEEVGKAWISN